MQCDWSHISHITHMHLIAVGHYREMNIIWDTNQYSNSKLKFAKTVR
jgi:hypothetical protein